jgi:hypothetical protein
MKEQTSKPFSELGQSDTNQNNAYSESTKLKDIYDINSLHHFSYPTYMLKIHRNSSANRNYIKSRNSSHNQEKYEAIMLFKLLRHLPTVISYQDNIVSNR